MVPGDLFRVTAFEIVFKKLCCTCLYDDERVTDWVNTMIRLHKDDAILCIAASVPCTCCEPAKLINVFLTCGGDIVKRSVMNQDDAHMLKKVTLTQKKGKRK